MALSALCLQQGLDVLVVMAIAGEPRARQLGVHFATVRVGKRGLTLRNASRGKDCALYIMIVIP